MKRTEYIVMTRMGSTCDFNRVYTDGEKLYIRTMKNGYQDIAGTRMEHGLIPVRKGTKWWEEK